MNNHSQFFGLFLIKVAVLYAFLFFLFLLNLVDIPILNNTMGRQSIVLIGLYFFTIFRPRLLPHWLMFAIGLLLDFLSGGIVGLNALCFVLLAMIVRGQRRFLLGQTWQVLWAGFFVAVGLIIGLQALVYGFSSMEFLSTAHIIFNIIISAFIYPLLLPFMVFINRWMNA